MNYKNLSSRTKFIYITVIGIVLILFLLFLSYISIFFRLENLKFGENTIESTLNIKNAVFEKQWVGAINGGEFTEFSGYNIPVEIRAVFNGIIWVIDIEGDLDEVDTSDAKNEIEEFLTVDEDLANDISESNVTRKDYEVPPYISFRDIAAYSDEGELFYDFDEGLFLVNKIPYQINGQNVFFGGFSSDLQYVLLGTNNMNTIDWSLRNTSDLSSVSEINNIPFGYTFLAPTGDSVYVIGTSLIDQNGTWSYLGELMKFDINTGEIIESYDVPETFLSPMYRKQTSTIYFDTFDQETQKIKTVLELEV